MLLVGRLVYEKGFHLALDALAGAIERYGDVRFVVAGTGTAEAELKKQARQLGLTKYGKFLGWVGDDMLHSLYRVSDVCLVPSIYEPFGLVALEAMASRLPLHRGRHRRPARGRAGRRLGRPALPLAGLATRWARSSRTCWPTTRPASASSPPRASTCSSSTGPRWPRRRPSCTAG